MNDYNFKASTELEMYTLLLEADIVGFSLDETDTLNVKPEDADETWQATGKKLYYSKTGALDVIGTIYKPTGKMISTTDDTGTTFEYPEQEPIEGFHANFRGDLTSEQLQIIETLLIGKPKNPLRVWA